MPLATDPALAALAPASSPLPPPDPAQWSERPAGPVVWGPVAPAGVPLQAPQASAEQMPSTAQAGAPWFTPASMPPPATSPAGQYGWLVQPDVVAPAAAPPSGVPLAPPSGPAMAPPSGPPTTPPPEQPASHLGIPHQVTPFDFGGPEALPADPGRPGTLAPSGPTSTTAPIAWVRADAPVASAPSATVAETSSPLTPAEPLLEPAGVTFRPADAPAGQTAQAAASPAAAFTGVARVLSDPVQQAAPAPTPAAAPVPMAMPAPTGRPVPLPPPTVPARPLGATPPGQGPNFGWNNGPGDPAFATPPQGAAWSQPNSPAQAATPEFPSAPAETGEPKQRSGRLGKVLIGVLLALLVAAVAYVLLFVTPGFLRSQEAPAGPPAIQTPETVAGLQKAAPAPGATRVMTQVAQATGAASSSQIATYAGANGTAATVWIANAAGGTPALSALEFENAGGGALQQLATVAPGPRGGEMGCAAASANRTVCFWVANGVRGAADIRGMGRAQAAELAARMRVGLEQPAA
jgi:hypothetical protein